MGHQTAIISDRRFRRQGGALCVLALLALGSFFLSPGRTADAALIGCETALPARSTEGLTYTLELNWDLGPVVGSGTIATSLESLAAGVSVDLDGDARSDGTVVLMIAAANANTGDPNFDTYFGVADFVAENPAHELLVEGYGLDYSQEITTAPLGNADVADGPVHLQFLLFLADPANWDAGTFGVGVTANYSDGLPEESHDVYDIRLDTTGADVSGSTTTTTPWPPVIGVALFDDNLLHDTLAVGINTAAGLFDQTIVPMSNLFVDVEIDQINDVARNDHIRLGLTGALADDGNGNVTSVGMPGEMAVAIVNECDALPQETFAGASHNGTAGGMPDTFEVDLSMYDGGDFDGTPGFDPDVERTLYVDATVSDPPTLLSAIIGGDDVDVDGDGTPDGFSLDDDHGADGIPDDRLPWEYVAVHHDGTTLPDLDAVIARRPLDGAAGPFYVAASIEDLPADASLDRAGVPTATDVAGDGKWDDVNGDNVVDGGDVALNADVGAIAFCPKNREVFPPTCTTPAVAAGRIEVGFQQEPPDAKGDGSLPVVYQSMSPPADDLTDTDDAHFPLTPEDWLRVNANTTTTEDAFGFDVLHVDIESAGIDVTGVEEVSWDLRADGQVAVHGNRLGTFGAEIQVEDLTGGATGALWSVLADAPDDLALSFDTAGVARDGDPIEVTWDTGRARTGAAVAVDAYLPATLDRSGQGARTIAASAWVGTGDGDDDGLPSNAVIAVDLDDRSGKISLEPLPPPVVPCVPRWGLPCVPGTPVPAGPAPAPMAFDAGFTTRTEAQEAAGMATRGKVSAQVPREFTLTWYDDGTTISSAELTTCAATAVPCPVEDIAGTVVITDWSNPVGHDALLGVEMIPVPDADGREFPDFTALPGTAGYPEDWAHVVLHDDPHMMNAPPADEVLDEGNEAGFDVHLAEVTNVRLSASTTFFDPSGAQGTQEVFNRLDVCFDAATTEPESGQEPALGLGFYMDEYPDGRGEPAATWVDATLTTETTDLRTTVQTNTPAPDSGGVIGDLTAAQAEYAEKFEDEANLVELTNWDCEQLEQGENRILTGRVRRGTESSVGKVLTLGTQSAAGDAIGIPVPAAPGIDAAIYAAEAGSTAYQALDAAVRLDVANVSIRQPLLRQCGVGNRQLDICHDLPEYDATTSSEVYLGVTSISEGGIGDLDVEYLTEPADHQDSPECAASELDEVDARLDDECALRAAVHIDHMGPTFTVDGTLDQRRRDGYLRTDLTMKNSTGDLAEVEASYRDDYDPATLGDPSERGDTDQPLASLALQRVGRTLTIDSTVWAPVYGWNGAPYNGTDCRTGWPGAVRDSHFFPEGDKPSDWPTLGPRPTDTLRPAYLHGRINLDPEDDGDPAETVTVGVDSRVDEPGNYEGTFVKGAAVENWYDDGHRQATKVGLDTDGVLTEGELWGAYPGLQMHVHQNPTWGEFETCVDADMPLHLAWSDVSDVRGALDLLKATVSVPDADKDAGGDATLAIEERLSSDFVVADPRIATGIWGHEIKTWLRGPLWPVNKDWASLITDERMSVGMLDPGDLKVDLPPHDEVGVQSHFASGWDDAGLNGGRYWGSVLLQALFHPTVEAEVAEDKGIQDTIDAWAGKDGFWTTIHETTESMITAWIPPELAPGTAIVDGKFAYQTHHECVDVEKNAVNDEFEPTTTTADGSTFEFAVRWDNQRVQLYLIGKYSNGQVRFVRELFDGDPGPKACKLALEGMININEWSGSIDVDLDLKVTAKETPAAGDWTPFNSDAFVFDASGNGWKRGPIRSNITADTPTAGEPVLLSGGAIEVKGLMECVWYPGDGTRITPDDEDIGENSLTATHTYNFPGTYHAMQLCYSTIAVDGQDPFLATVREGTIAVLAPR